MCTRSLSYTGSASAQFGTSTATNFAACGQRIFSRPRSHCRRCCVTVMARQNESEEEKAARKAAKKQAKEAKRLVRQGLAPDAVGQKECTLCHRPRDLLIRCQVDASGKWHMVCGRCWMQASGGQVDGTLSKPHYRYGGLWKNHHKSVSGKNKVPDNNGQQGAASSASLAVEVVEPVRNHSTAGSSKHLSMQQESTSELQQLLLAEAAAASDDES